MKDSGIVPYALRHSSIVRWLRGTTPLDAAKQHDTSLSMIERHYGKFVRSSADDLAARMAISFGPATDGSNVHQLRTA